MSFPPQITRTYYREYDKGRAFVCLQVDGRRFLSHKAAGEFARKSPRERARVKQRKLSPFQDVTDDAYSKEKWPEGARLVTLENGGVVPYMSGLQETGKLLSKDRITRTTASVKVQ